MPLQAISEVRCKLFNNCSNDVMFNYSFCPSLSTNSLPASFAHCRDSLLREWQEIHPSSLVNVIEYNQSIPRARYWILKHVATKWNISVNTGSKCWLIVRWMPASHSDALLRFMTPRTCRCGISGRQWQAAKLPPVNLTGYLRESLKIILISYTEDTK